MLKVSYRNSANISGCKVIPAGRNADRRYPAARGRRPREYERALTIVDRNAKQKIIAADILGEPGIYPSSRARVSATALGCAGHLSGGDFGRCVMDCVHVPRSNQSDQAVCDVHPCKRRGRDQYLFAGSDAGGRPAAAMYSLIESAKLNGLNWHSTRCKPRDRVPEAVVFGHIAVDAYTRNRAGG